MHRRNTGQYKLQPERQFYMKDTYGLYVYQEQYMYDAQTYAGWSIAFADKHIRKNKKLSTDDEIKNKFISDSVGNGHNKEEMLKLWSEIVENVTSGYAFCQGHATSYAVLSYQTAWLKHNYPTHFYAALMTSKGDDSTAISELIHEVRSKGIEVVPPDINKSTNKFVASGNKIYYRITSVNSVGGSALKSILERRPFKSVEDLISRTTRSELKTNVIANIIKSGCFDWQEVNRAKLLYKTYKLLGIKDIEEEKYDDANKWLYEKESLGVYLSSHPLDKYAYKSFMSFSEGDIAIVGGEVIELVVRKDKSGNDMCFLTLGTKHGNVRALIFSKNFNKSVLSFIESTKFIQITGKKSGESILVNKMEKI